MCAPPALAAGSLAVSALSSGVGFMGQQAAAGVAQGQANLAARGWERNEVEALAADRDNQTALLDRQLQEDNASGLKMHAQAIDTARRMADAEVASAGEGHGQGVGGVGLDSLTANIGRMAEDNRISTMQNWNSTVAQLQSEKQSSIAQDISRTNSVGGGTPPVAPSPAGAILSTAGAGLKYMADYSKINSPNTYATTTVQ